MCRNTLSEAPSGETANPCMWRFVVSSSALTSRSRTTSPGCTRSVGGTDRKSTRLNSSHSQISYAVFCLKKKKKESLVSRADDESHALAFVGRDVHEHTPDG